MGEAFAKGSTLTIGRDGTLSCSTCIQEGFTLTRNMKQAACQCPSRWGRKSVSTDDAHCKDEVLGVFEANYQRAVLQLILQNDLGELDLKIISKCVVRHAVKLDDELSNWHAAHPPAKASERQTAEMFASLRHFSTEATSQPGTLEAALRAAFVTSYAKPSCEALLSHRLKAQTTSSTNAVPTQSNTLPSTEALWARYRAYLFEQEFDEKHQPADEAVQALPYRIVLSALWSLRAILGELLERTILLDRVLFLRESLASHRAIAANVHQPLDPFLSPRCFAVVGTVE